MVDLAGDSEHDRLHSIEKAKRTLGYKPQDGATDDLRPRPVPKRDR